MFSELFIIKALVSISIVMLLSLIAERWSPRIAGILSGYPTGTAISLFFFGLEISPEFVSNSVTYNLLGLIATQIFVYFYYKSTLFFKKGAILFSPLSAIFAYFIFIYLLSFIRVDLFSAFILSLASTLIFLYAFKRIKNVRIKETVKISNKLLVMRVLVAASIIISITELAKFIGPTWAGLLSSFPSTLLPLFLILHYTYKKENLHSLIKNIPIGNIVLIFYSLSVSFVYPAYGVYIGTAISLVIATLMSLIWRRFI